MQKTYKLNNVEISAEEIKKLVKENPEIMEEKKVEGRFFFPKDGDTYCRINEDGSGICKETYVETNYPSRSFAIKKYGVHRTTEQAEKEVERRKALVRIRKYVTENGLLFEPDWSDYSQLKLYVTYCHQEGVLVASGGNSFIQNQFETPYLKHDDIFQVMKACKQDYLIYFGVK